MSKAQAVRGALEALVDAYKRTFDPETYYHGTTDPNIKKFDPRSREATYFTADPNYASGYSDPARIGKFESTKPEAAVVYPVKIKTDEIFDYSDEKSWQKLYERDEALGGPTGTENLEEYMHHFKRQFQDSADLIAGEYRAYEGHVNFLNYLKERGFRGYRTNEPETIALFHPDKGDVRSIHAKFDPEKSESGNILASVPAAALFALGGAGALSNLADE